MCSAVRKGRTRGPGQPGLQALEPLALVPSAPFVEEGARNPEEPTGTADTTADLLEVLKDAQAGRRPLGPLPVANHSVHPGPPFAGPPWRGPVLSGHHLTATDQSDRP